MGFAVAAAAVFSITLPGFFSVGNALALARAVSILGVLALGMALVVIGRGIDLSQIATLAVSAALAVTLINAGLSSGVALLLGLVLAVTIGVANGFLIAVVEIPALFATLAMGLFVVGLTRAFVVPHYQVFLSPGHDGLLALGRNVAGGIPVPLLVFAGCAVVVHVFLSRTVLGRFIYAHGDNVAAARLSGIGVRPLTMLEYALSATIGYIGGLMMVASTALMHLQIAESTLIFDVILVVVLGGVSLVGGRGNVFSVVAGTLLIGVLLNGMTIMNLDTQTQDIIKGIVLLAAIGIDSYMHPREEETAKQGD
ncbi:ABC transporter permease [Chelatococcus reniformis]|uniref:ABC transporter permease n=2 Tax=Chelatococcus reniformis TaxID=1494448 RepID=A0A916UU29_9HYPH|nr:ABC transporter permease [Chelatococcus reniformis]